MIQLEEKIPCEPPKLLPLLLLTGVKEGCRTVTKRACHHRGWRRWRIAIGHGDEISPEVIRANAAWW